MLNLINQRLSIGMRLAVVGGMFTLLALGITAFNVTKGIDSSNFSQKELRGARNAEKVWKLVQSTKQDQAADASLIAGNNTYDSEFDTAPLADAVTSADSTAKLRVGAAALLTKISNSSNIDLEPNSPCYDIGRLFTKDLAALLDPLNAMYSNAKATNAPKRNEELKLATMRFKCTPPGAAALR